MSKRAFLFCAVLLVSAGCDHAKGYQHHNSGHLTQYFCYSQSRRHM